MSTQTITKDLTSQVDGVASQFVTPDDFIVGSLVVYVDGDRVRPNVVAEDDSSHFTLEVTPPPGSGLLVQYEVASLDSISVSGIPPLS